MKKQSSGHRVDRQDVSTVTPFPGQSLEGSKPRGVHTHGIANPTELDRGAAESHTKPVDIPPGENGATGSETPNPKAPGR